MKKQLIDHALMALRYGLAVFPLKPRTKDPATPHGVLDATTDEGQIHMWWTKNSGFNIGVTNGVIVDCDRGLNSLEEARTFALLQDWPPTLLVRTGRRTSFGCQFHFTGTAENGNYFKNGVSGEIRSYHEYGLWCGSIHPISGEAYEIAIDLPRAPCPPDLLKGARKKKSSLNNASYSPVSIWKAREIFAEKLADVMCMQEGERHHTAHICAWYAARCAEAGVFEFHGESETEIKQRILDAVEPHYGSYERDLRKMLRDSWESGIAFGRLILNFTPKKSNRSEPSPMKDSTAVGTAILPIFPTLWKQKHF